MRIKEYGSLIDRMEKLIQEYNRTGAQAFRLSVSHGAAPGNTKSDLTLERLMEEVDSELYKNKKRKKAELEEFGSGQRLRQT